MLEALGRGELAPGPDAGPELHFGAEVLRRVLGKPAVEDEAWIACLETSTTCHLDSDFEESPLVDYLTPRERVAVRRRNEKSRPPEVGPQRQASPPAPRDSLLRLVSGLPGGVARDLFDLESCRSTRVMRWFSVAVIDFRPDGLPRRVGIRTEPSGASCRRTARTLFLMSLAPLDDPDPVAHPTPYLALFDADTIQCPDILPPRTTDARPGPDLVRVRAKVVAPKLLKKVEPLYPRESRRKGEQGVSIYEAIISATGCIQELRLVRSSTPTLDIMGMEAVSRWSYAPATLDGRPVRVWLTVTVTYRLQ